MVERRRKGGAAGRSERLAASLVWAVHHGETRDRMIARVSEAAAHVGALPHESSCPAAEAASLPCVCARGRALRALALPVAPPAPRDLPVDLSEREAAFFDEVYGRLEAQASLHAADRAALEARVAELERGRDAAALRHGRKLADARREAGAAADRAARAELLLARLRSKSQLPLVAYGLLHVARVCDLCGELATCYVELRSRIARRRRPRSTGSRRVVLTALYCDAHGRERGGGRARELAHAHVARALPWVAGGAGPTPRPEDMPPASLAMLLRRHAVARRPNRDDLTAPRNPGSVR